jgi:hypothetical protein
VLTWFAVALIGGAVAVAVGWALRRVDELGRPRRPGATPRRGRLGAGRGKGGRPLPALRGRLRRRRARARLRPLAGDAKPEPWTLIKRDAHTARLLGAPDAAAQLAADYWSNIHPLMPDRYRSGDCRPGGALDERLADAPWLAPASS